MVGRGGELRGWVEALDGLDTADPAALRRARADAAMASERFAQGWEEVLTGLFAEEAELLAA